MLRVFCMLLCLLSSIALMADDQPSVTGTVKHHPNLAGKDLLARNIDVWLPPSYGKDTAQRHPVVYMHDGQNLFDPTKSFIGVDWGVDEAMSQLIADGKIREAIVVGIWNTQHRTREYLPEKPLRNYTRRDEVFKELAEGGGTQLTVDDLLADKYLKFLVTELKPFVDKTYRTLPGRDDTFIMGSSAGALISLYASCEYPQVFGGAGSVSGHYPLGNGMLVGALRCELPDPRCHKLYFDFGTETLDKSYEPFQWQMDAAVADRGYTRGCNWLTCKFFGADHSERAWRARVDIPLEFFLRKDQGRVYPRHWWTAIDDPNKPSWEILPQEAKPGEVILSKRNELGLLSNFAATPFTFRGKRYASLEGFWQAMKYPEGPDDPRSADPNIEWKFTRDEVAQMKAFAAKEAGDLASANMHKLGIDWVSFDCKRFLYRPETPGEHYDLIVAATEAKVRQNPIVSSVLLSTGDLVLKPDHHQEADLPAAWQYYEILMRIRDGLRR